MAFNKSKIAAIWMNLTNTYLKNIYILTKKVINRSFYISNNKKVFFFERVLHTSSKSG